MPSVLFAPVSQIALWGKVFHHLFPGAIQWPAGTRVNKISADILLGIENRIKQIILGLELPATVEVGITDTGHLKIMVWAFGDHYYPIYFKEMMEAIRPLPKKLQALTEEALILLGSRNLMNWVDIKEFAEDNVEMMFEDETEIVEMKKKFKACGPPVSPFVRSDRREQDPRIARFADTVERLRLKEPPTILVADFLKSVARLVRTSWVFEFAVTEFDDTHMELGRVMPIFYSMNDEVSQYHYEEMESNWQGGGAIFGEQMVFEVDPEILKGKSLLRCLDRYLEEIRNLALYNKVYLLADEMMSKEEKANE